MSILMAMLAMAAVAQAPAGEPCRLQLISSNVGQNHVLFHGLSPNGRILAVGWDKGSGSAIQRGAFLLDLRTGERTDLPHLNNAPSFSPDGNFLVSANYAADRSLRTEIVELDRHTATARTFASARSGEWLASYSRDGKSILFNSTRSGGSDLYRVRRGDGVLEQLTSDPRYEAHGSFIDGGRRVIFHRQTQGDNYDIIIRDLRTGTEQAVGATPAEEAYPAMSPDGRWIAFSAVRSPGSQPNLYLMRRDGHGLFRLTESAAKDAYVTWAQDGRSLYFVRFGIGGSVIHRLTVKGGRCAR